MDYAPPRRPYYPQPEEIGRLLTWVATASAEEVAVVLGHPGLSPGEPRDRMERDQQVVIDLPRSAPMESSLTKARRDAQRALLAGGGISTDSVVYITFRLVLGRAALALAHREEAPPEVVASLLEPFTLAGFDPDRASADGRAPRA